MDKKELLKRWSLAYTEPSLFYIPWRKLKETYTVEFRRYANVQVKYSSLANYYMIDKEVPYSANAEYYILDKNGNYYDSIGISHGSTKFKLWSNTIKLPKGQYFYKEMRSVTCCRLIEDIMPFTVTGSQDVVIMHHQANMMTINYHIELMNMCFATTIKNYSKDIENSRKFHLAGERSDRYRAEDLRDIKINSIYNTDTKIPIIKIDSVSSYKKEYTDKIKFDINFVDIESTGSIKISENSDAEFQLPKTDDDWNLTYNVIQGWVDYKPRKLIYNTVVNNTSYENDFINTANNNYITNIIFVNHTDGQTYNNYTISDITWYYNPNNRPVGNWDYEAYNMTSNILSGFNGTMTDITIPSKNTVLYTNSKIECYKNKKTINIDPKTGEETVTEDETPSKVVSVSDSEYSNFNETTLLSSVFTGLSDNEDIRFTAPHLYKKKGNNITCYTGYISSSRVYVEKREAIYGSDIENKNADEIFVGALIEYEERQE